MPDGYEVLSKVSGLPVSEINEIWQQVKANAKTLDECGGPHDFQSLDPGKPLAKYRCTVCGGTVDGTDKLWYERGLKDARKEAAGA